MLTVLLEAVLTFVVAFGAGWGTYDATHDNNSAVTTAPLERQRPEDMTRLMCLRVNAASPGTSSDLDCSRSRGR